MPVADLVWTKMSKDPFDVGTRSQVMKAVGTRDTAPELRLRHHLWRAGLRYRKHPKIANVTPDFAFLGPRIAVFVDGCFWHGCPRHYVPPVGNAAFWRNKLQRNRARDRLVDDRLMSNGWTVYRVWECDVHRQLDWVTTHLRHMIAQNSHKRNRESSNVCDT